MKTSTRILASLAALVAAISVSTLATGAAAMAAPSKIPPITTLLTPQVKVTVTPTPYALVGTIADVTVTANWSDGSMLDGTVVVSEITSAGTTVISSANASFFHVGYLFNYPVNSPGDVTFQAHFAPPTGTFGSSATGSVIVHGRVGGYPAVALSLGKSVAGTSTPVTATLTLPAAGSAYPVGGSVQIDVDALGTLASCVPVRTSATSASCSTSLPGSLKAGPHAITGNFVGSTTFLNGTFASTFTVLPAPAPAAKSTTSSGSTPAPSATPTTPANPAPSATAVAAPTTSDSVTPEPQVLPATNASSTMPLWIGIAIAILLVAFLAIAALVTVAVIRSRRNRVAV